MLGGIKKSLRVDACIPVGDDVPQTDRSLQSKSGIAIDDIKLLEASKALC